MSREEIDVSVIVNVKTSPNPGKSQDVRILFPSEQMGLTTEQTTHILASGIGLLVKSLETPKEQGELVSRVMEHLDIEFSSLLGYDGMDVSEEILKP